SKIVVEFLQSNSDSTYEDLINKIEKTPSCDTRSLWWSRWRVMTRPGTVTSSPSS
ncbi:DNMT1 isoform 17, partial [Pan troglodytes]